MLAANAAAINRHTQEIGDIYNQPVVALDKITQASATCCRPWIRWTA